MPNQRVIAYVDGFNLYYGIRQRAWKHLYWIDPHKLASAIAPKGVDSIQTKYFTARIKGPDDKRDRQTRFLDAIRTGESQIILGQFSRRDVKCRACGNKWMKHEEKMTDSAIAAHLVADAFLDRFDVAILIGGDTDIVPAVKLVRLHHANKTLLAWYPPRRSNDAVGNSCHGAADINYDHLTEALMPDEVDAGDGLVIQRPPDWARADA